MPEDTDLSVVIPVYNEAGNLPILADEIDRALSHRFHRGGLLGDLGRSYEVIFVDDGSSDASLDVLCRLASERPHFRVLRMRRNSGQSAALAAGFHAVRAPVVVTLDADLQNDPADIPLLLSKLDGDCDVVSGIRVDRHDSWVRRASSWIANTVRNRVVHFS